MKKCINLIAAFAFLIAFSGINFTSAGCPTGSINNGKCSVSKNCFASVSDSDCDPTRPPDDGGGSGGGNEPPSPPVIGG